MKIKEKSTAQLHKKAKDLNVLLNQKWGRKKKVCRTCKKQDYFPMITYKEIL